MIEAAEGDVETRRKEAIEAMKSSTRQYATQQLKWIKFKLLPLAHTLGTTNMPIYILDATDPTQWSTKVLSPALTVATGPPTLPLSPARADHRSFSARGEVTFTGGCVPSGRGVIEPCTTAFDAG